MPLTLPESRERSHLGGVATAGGFWAFITARSGLAYAWSEASLAASGTWSVLAGGRSGTTGTQPAYEVHGNPIVPFNLAVWLRAGRGAARDYRFHCNVPLLGKLAAQLNHNEYGDFNVYSEASGAAAATGQVVVVINGSNRLLAPDLWCIAQWIGGFPLVSPYQCSTGSFSSGDPPPWESG